MLMTTQPAVPVADNGGALALWDWRRRVAHVYAQARAEPDPEAAWRLWRHERDRLFAEHPQSPLDAQARAGFSGLPFFAYDPGLRLHARLAPTAGASFPVAAGADGEVLLRPFARTLGLAGRLGRELTLFWLEGYGGGAFLPFGDASNGRESYGGGRYLLETIKGADLGEAPDGELILDFNFAYNPSCAYSPMWVCPLAPPENRLAVEVRAGEMR